MLYESAGESLWQVEHECVVMRVSKLAQLTKEQPGELVSATVIESW